MSSSLLIDPEVLEWRYPVRLKPHPICTARGGAGRWRGSNGAIRHILFVRP
ncbi:hydantoinase B/oxoprolinase family protein [Paraburkholderia phenoliruptrix]|uniref:hydantoinase B/oxoprolinase family protein n=1 Tax=Paraburkholderia phenoliruptrix TaxID=252970 RepID=UPI001CB78DAC|nr:hydantoinase B/oxoprolinase family protein [Paraburkholderia phenoliruptrix]